MLSVGLAWANKFRLLFSTLSIYWGPSANAAVMPENFSFNTCTEAQTNKIFRQVKQ